MTDENPVASAIIDLQTATVALGTSAEKLRRADYITEKERREVVGWLDDLGPALQRSGQAFQRLMERSSERHPLAMPGGGGNPDGPTVIVHEQGEGPRG